MSSNNIYYKWFKSKSRNFQYSLIGAISYPSIIFLTYILWMLLTIFGLRTISETIIKIITYPIVFPSLKIVYYFVKNPMDYWVPMIFISLFFSALFWAIIWIIVSQVVGIYVKK